MGKFVATGMRIRTATPLWGDLTRDNPSLAAHENFMYGLIETEVDYEDLSRFELRLYCTRHGLVKVLGKTMSGPIRGEVAHPRVDFIYSLACGCTRAKDVANRAERRK